MPRKGWTSISIPIVVKNQLETFCERLGLSLGQCVDFLYEFYQSIVHDPGMKGYFEKKKEKAMKRVIKRWKEMIAESKELDDREWL